MMQILKDHWFKIAIIAILAYAVFKKDFSINFNSNEKREEKAPESQGKYTDKTIAVSENEEVSLLDFLMGGSSSKNFLQSRYEAVSEPEKVEFVKRFGKVARAEQDKFEIPTSVILATAMVQSFGGQRGIAQSGNNFFALRCSKSWEDKKTVQEEDRCYRAYPTAWESFRDHSVFLKQHITIKKGDYKDWLKAIATKFNTGDDYYVLVKNVIEQYKLNKLD